MEVALARFFRIFALLFLSLVGSGGPGLTVYVGALSSNSVTLAWGTTAAGKRNTIGRDAEIGAEANVRVGDTESRTKKAWLTVGGLAQDSEYRYSVQVPGYAEVDGTIRTWPAKADSFVFFVIGDWGSGSSAQRYVAQMMEDQVAQLAAQGKPVRFILSTGDNIYGGLNNRGSGAYDRDWERRFFHPYANLLRRVPFYAVPGNHDGNESERRQDLATYLDNFFFPSPKPTRWYRFEVAGLAEFIALDSTRNTLEGPPAPAFASGGEESRWLTEQMERPSDLWRIAVMHHPMFTAGPGHPPFLSEAPHWFSLFQKGGIQVVFAGHEHNFQFSERDAETKGIQFVVSGAGGQLRSRSVLRKMKTAHIAGWANRNHFCIVEITQDQMTVTPIGGASFSVLGPNGDRLPTSFRISK